MTRLNTDSPQIFESLSKASPDQRKAAMLDACKHALHAVSLPSVHKFTDTLDALAHHQSISAANQTELALLADKFDEEYFSLHQQAEDNPSSPPDYMLAFRRARAVSALLYASRDSSVESVAESIYEAAQAAENKENIYAAVNSILHAAQRSTLR